MTEESFLLVSLKEEKAKELAQAITSETCRKVLDFLATKKEATESDISKKLNIPLSTAHYNLQQLVKANLVKVDEFHYSEKGKEVNHYSLSKKFVIIAPESTPESFKDKLRKILPVVLIVGVAAGAIQLFSEYGGVITRGGRMFAQKAAEEAAEATVTSTQTLMDEELAFAAPQQLCINNHALWFLAGAVFVMVVYVLISWIRSRKK